MKLTDLEKKILITMAKNGRAEEAIEHTIRLCANHLTSSLLTLGGLHRRLKNPEIPESNIQELTFSEPEDFTHACRIWVYLRSDQVGYSCLIREGNVAKLADILIYDHFRSRGIGSALLNHVIRFCQANGISAIKGNISGDHLIPWYFRHGFFLNRENELLFLIVDDKHLDNNDSSVSNLRK